MPQRPALIGAAVMACGILTAKYWSLPWEYSLAAAAVILSAAVVAEFLKKKRRGRESDPALLVLLLLYAASIASYSVSTQVRQQQHITRFLSITDTVTIRGRVAERPAVLDGKTRLLLSVTSIAAADDSAGTEGNILLTVFPDKRKKETPTVIPYGSIISFRSILQHPGSERNPGEFSYKDYLALQDVFGVVFVRGYSEVTVESIGASNPLYEYLLYPAKDHVIASITTAMKGDEASFLIGLLLGDRSGISEEIKTAFINTGTIHVLAVSGTHVVLVAGIIFILVGLVRLPRMFRFIAAMTILLFYMMLTGATPSVVRATLMIVILYIGKIFEERTDVYNVLGAAAIIILVYDPKQLFDVGFQLSFSAVFSIVYFYPKVNALSPKIKTTFTGVNIINTIWQLFAVSLAAQIGTLPFTAYYFGKISLIALVANLIIVPLVGVIVTIGMSGVIVGIISMPIASLFSEVNNIAAMMTLSVVKWAEQVPFAVIHTARFGWEETMMYSIAVLFVTSWGNSIMQKRILIIGLFGLNIMLLSSIIRTDQQILRITFLDVGQGDGAVIQIPTGETIVVDAGPVTPGFDAGEKIIAPFLRRNGISSVDAVITSHPHSDHLGGIPHIIKNFTVRRAMDADQRARSQLFYEYDGLKRTTEAATLRAGMMLPVGNARLYVLHPTAHFIDSDSADGYSDLNQSSVVIKLQYGATSVLLTGDAETEAEEHIAHLYGDFLRSDLLKAGHHGSSTSSSELFLRDVQPTEVIVSVARFNKFKHPSPKVLSRFSAMGAVIHRTDRDGAVIFESNGTQIKPVSWRDG